MVIRPSKITEYFCKLSIEDLQQIPDIGPTVAQSIYDWFHDKHNIELLEKMGKAGIEIEVSKFSAKGGQASSNFLNKTFVLTGELDSLSRDEAKAKIRELGGDISSSVSKNTDYVVVGKSSGTKYDKAKELGVKTISEEEFLKMIE